MHQNDLTLTEAAMTHLSRCTCVVPMGKISIDFPQNLFLHLRSAKVIMEKSFNPFISIAANQLQSVSVF